MKFLCILILSVPMLAAADELSLVTFLKTAWDIGPVRRAELLQKNAADEFISSARGKYLPHLSLDAIDSTGFAASNSDLGVGGLMASPFRVGPAGGVTVQQTVYDFGRIQSALALAKAQKSLDLAQVASDKFHFLFSAGQLYLTCAETKSLQRADEQLLHWGLMNLRETERFTRTGQRSIIDNSLVKTEVSVLKIELAQIDKFQQSLRGQMKMFGGDDCRHLSQSWQERVPGDLQVDEPTILLARAQAEISHANYESAKSNQLPTIQVMGSAGEMDDVRVVNRQDYAAGIGFVFPFWNGGEDARRERAYEIETDYQNENLKTAQLEYSAKLKDMTDLVSRDRDELQQLDDDLVEVRKSMELATRRYRLLQGPLIDVREAFKQLRAMELERIHVLQALGSTSLQLGILRTRSVQ